MKNSLNHEIKFSIIIPSYNNRNYLNKCIDSVLSQSYTNYELIIVDDGSTDGSYEFLKNNYSNNKQIKIFSKKNSGVADTRNLALKHVTGDWITFLDSDDYFNSEILSEAFHIISKHDIDFLAFNLYLINENGNFVSNYLYDHMNSMLLDSVEEISDYIYACLSITNFNQKMHHAKFGNARCVGGKFYRSDIVQSKNIIFPSNLITFEDGIFNLLYYSECRKIYLSNQKKYYYFQNSSSATHKKTFDSTYSNFLNIVEILNNTFSDNYKDVMPLFFDESIHMLCNVIAIEFFVYNQKVFKCFEKLHNVFLNNPELFRMRKVYKLLQQKHYFIVFLFYKFRSGIKKIKDKM